MKIRALCVSIIALVSILAAAQDRQTVGPTAADFFVKAPLDVASQLSETSRLDMIDYFNNGATVKSENRLGRKVALKKIEDRLIVWQDDDSVMTTLVVLPVMQSSASDTVMVVIRTFAGQLPDSEVRYYDKGWSLIDNSDVPAPKLKDWLNVTDKQSVALVERSIPFILSTAEYDLNDNNLVFTNRTSDFFTPQDTPDAVSMLKPELRYEWTGRRFKPVLR